MSIKHSIGDMSRILDAIDANIAVLDAAGIIQLTNAGWQDFAKHNPLTDGSEPHCTEVGTNYLDICRSALGISNEGAMYVHDGLLAVMQGRKKKFTHEYPCHSPTRQRWFLMTVLPLPRSKPRMVVVTHIDITARYLAELRMLNKQQELDAALSNLQQMTTRIKDELVPVSGAVAFPRQTRRLPPGSPDFLGILSKRENEVCLGLVRGERNIAIAERLNLSRKSISTYRTRIFDKLKVGSIAELVSLAARHQLL